MRVPGSKLIAVAVVALLGGCPGGGKGGGGDGDTLPGGFVPGPALDDPPPADPSALGHAFMKQVEPAFQERWHGFLENCRLRLPPDHPLNDPSLVATVDIAVDSSGRAAAVELGRGSGNDEFDVVALEVARDVTGYPTPGADVLSDDGRVHLTWTFARDRRQAGLAGASIQRVEYAPDKAVPQLLARGDFAEAARRAKTAGEGGVALADSIAEAAIVAALESADVEDQRAAIEAAGAVGLKAAAPALRALARDAADLELRKAAVIALGLVGDADAVTLLTDVLANDSEEAQLGAAAQALHALGAGDKAWELLRPALASDDQTERWKALVALAHFPAPDAVPELSGLLGGSGPRGQRLAAAAALGAAVPVAGNKAAKPLIACLRETDAAVRAACAQALADAAGSGFDGKPAYWAVVKLVKDRDERVRAAATLAAARLGKAKFAKELGRLRKEAKPAVLAALADGLRDVPGDAALKRLVSLVRHEDAGVRLAAVRSLVRRGDDLSAAGVQQAWIDTRDVETLLYVIAGMTDEDKLRRDLAEGDARIAAAALRRLGVTAGRDAVVGDMLQLVAEAPSAGHRATIAGGWLSAR